MLLLVGAALHNMCSYTTAHCSTAAAAAAAATTFSATHPQRLLYPPQSLLQCVCCHYQPLRVTPRSSLEIRQAQQLRLFTCCCCCWLSGRLGRAACLLLLLADLLFYACVDD
jgi:hypothetical protein